MLHIIPDGRSGGNRNIDYDEGNYRTIIPDGRSGGEPQLARYPRRRVVYYTRWEIGGGTATVARCVPVFSKLYPMGDRGGTATPSVHAGRNRYYTRWEIGGEPQPIGVDSRYPFIIPDGRSGGNRNSYANVQGSLGLYPMGDRGGTATGGIGHHQLDSLYPMGDRGGTATCSSRGIAVL